MSKWTDHKWSTLLNHAKSVSASILPWFSALLNLSTWTQGNATNLAWLDLHTFDSWKLSLLWWTGELRKSSLKESVQHQLAPMQCPALKKHCSVCLVQIASGNSSTVDLRPGVACKPQSLGNLTHPSGEPGVAAICSIKWNLLLQIGTLSKTALEDERRWKNRTNMNKMNLWSECFKQILQIVASHGFKL